MRTRFAPSPNGYLHMGHAFSALTVWQAARDVGGEALLRIDDIDQSRARGTFEDAIFDDLAWLGLSWPEPVRRQSEHVDAYAAALTQLRDMGVTYPCFCTRKHIALNAQGHYAGTCRSLTLGEVRHAMDSGLRPAIRLNAARALSHAGPIPYTDTDVPQYVGQAPLEDAVIARRDIATSYLLSCVVDDAGQAISHVIRGVDIQPLTALQVLLQHLLGLPTPVYSHHSLITDADQEKLSKSKGSPSLRDLKAQGMTAEAIRQHLGFA